MARELRCRDAGFDCDGVLQADSDDEVMDQAAVHVRQIHGLEQIDSGTEHAIRAQIHDA